MWWKLCLDKECLQSGLTAVVYVPAFPYRSSGAFYYRNFRFLTGTIRLRKGHAFKDGLYVGRGYSKFIRTVMEIMVSHVECDLLRLLQVDALYPVMACAKWTETSSPWSASHSTTWRQTRNVFVLSFRQSNVLLCFVLFCFVSGPPSVLPSLQHRVVGW
jgi:hypothetical protein